MNRSNRTAGTFWRSLAGFLALLTLGCQTTERRGKTAPNPSNPRTLGPTGPTTTKTDFHRDVSATQQFNVHLELARVYESQSNFEAAVTEYQKAADVAAIKGTILAASKLGPAQQALAQRRMAAALDRLGRFAQAGTHYQQAMKLAPHDSRVWNDVGYSYYLQNRFDDAERSLKTADAMEPNNPRVLTNLGLVQAAQGKNNEALNALVKANGPAVGHANLGFILAAMGKPAEARKHYTEALVLQPQLAAARSAIAQLDAPPRPASLASAVQPALIAPPQPTPLVNVAQPMVVALPKGSRTTPAAGAAAPSPPLVNGAPVGVVAPPTDDPQLSRTTSRVTTLPKPTLPTIH